MSSCDRRTLILLAALAPLAACGFTPALAPGAPAAALRGRIRADDPRDADDFALVARLEERLGRPEAPVWRLSWTLAVTEDRLGRTRDLGDTRGQMAGTLRYRIAPLGATEGAPAAAAGTVSAFSGYSRTATPLANRAAEEAARRRLMVMLADALTTELTATAGGWATP